MKTSQICRFLIMSSLLFSLIGCSHPQLLFDKPGLTREEFNRDKYDCIQQSRTSWGGGGTGSIGIAMMTASKSDAEKQAEELFKLCMEARGYTAREVGDEGFERRRSSSYRKALSPKEDADKETNYLISTSPQAKEWAGKSSESFKREDWTEVIRTASVSIAYDPEFAAPYINRCWAYYKKGFIQDALTDCNRAIEIEPGNSNPYINRAMIYLEMGRFSDASNDCDKAIIIDPNNALFYNNRGYLHKNKGDIAEAKGDYLRACNMGFDLGCNNYREITGYLPAEISQILSRLIDESLTSFQKKDWDTVIKKASEAIKLDPGNAASYVNRAGAYANKGFFQQAIADSEIAIKINPDYGLAYNNQGFAYEGLGKTKEAALNYEIACKLGSGHGCRNYDRLKDKK